MKKMTKEELIEYFIEQLGDNKILGQVMTIDQIRKKLQETIKEVTYNSENVCTQASWKIHRDGKGTMNFDLSKISDNDEKVVVVHESLHALSTTTAKIGISDTLNKCGLNIERLKDKEKNIIKKNIAINEGMTDFLAERITGIMHDGYSTEKSIYKILKIIIGHNAMMKKAFVNEASESAGISFRDELITKYGKYIGDRLNEELKRILALSDQLLNLDTTDEIQGLSIGGKRLQKQTKHEINMTLTYMERVAFEEQNFSELNIEEKLIIYFYLAKEGKDTTEIINDIYRSYIESGQISEEVFSKKGLLKELLTGNPISTVEELNEILNHSQYFKIGNYYALQNNNNRMNTQIFDTKGHLVKGMSSCCELVDDLDFIDLPSDFSVNKMEKIIEQLKKKYEQYESLFNEELYDCAVEVFNDIIRVEYYNREFDYYEDPRIWNERDYYGDDNSDDSDYDYDREDDSDDSDCEPEHYYEDYYLINSDGTLEIIIPRRKKKNYR